MFGTIPDWSLLSDVVNWILDDGGKEDFDNAIENVLPAATHDILETHPALRIAWTGDHAARVAAHIWLMEFHDWRGTDQDDWATKHAIMIRRSLLDPATPAQIAEGLSTLADVLDQSVSERSAAFIIELIENARLPVYPLNALFETVAKAEAGKIKPASFNRLLGPMRDRINRVVRQTEARMFVTGLEAGLAYYREHLAEKPTAGFG